MPSAKISVMKHYIHQNGNLYIVLNFVYRTVFCFVLNTYFNLPLSAGEVIPVTAILTGRGFLGVVAERDLRLADAVDS